MYNSLFNPFNTKEQSRNTSLELERRSRIFDTKIRQIGVDVDALNSQIVYKNNEQHLERERNRKFDVFNAVVQREQSELKRKDALEREIAAKQLNHYRLVKQRKQFRTEYDINFPKNIRKAPSSIYSNEETGRVRFEAENYDEGKVKMKVVQWKNYLKEQIEEQKTMKHNLNLAEKSWASDNAVHDKIDGQCTDLIEAAKKHQHKLICTFNALKARENQINKNNEKLKNDTEVMAHIYNCLTSSFYLEDGNDSATALGAHRVDRNYFKGMSDQQLDNIMQARMQQITEKNNIRLGEQSTEKYFHRFQETTLRQQKFENDCLEQKRRDIRRRLNDENKLLAKQQLIRKREMAKIAKSNPITEHFFAQFNKTSR